MLAKQAIDLMNQGKVVAPTASSETHYKIIEGKVHSSYHTIDNWVADKLPFLYLFADSWVEVKHDTP